MPCLTPSPPSHLNASRSAKYHRFSSFYAIVLMLILIITRIFILILILLLLLLLRIIIILTIMRAVGRRESKRRGMRGMGCRGGGQGRADAA